MYVCMYLYNYPTTLVGAKDTKVLQHGADSDCDSKAEARITTLFMKSAQYTQKVYPLILIAASERNTAVNKSSKPRKTLAASPSPSNPSCAIVTMRFAAMTKRIWMTTHTPVLMPTPAFRTPLKGSFSGH